MSKVGLFFYVKGTLLTDMVDIDKAETYGECRIGRSSHYEVWDAKYYKIYRTPYDYYPRGRVVCRYKENKYVVYVDKCIDEIDIINILETFELKNENFEIDKTDSHYVCKKCNKYYCL